MAINWQFYHWHLEPSSICALRCPRCPRTEHPNTPWLNQNMTLNFVKKFLTTNMLTNNVRRITMCGDVGDPIYCKEYIDICRYIKTVNPNIHIFTITNGSYKKSDWWAELASVLNHRDTINFSIDGFDNESNNLYRINSNYPSIMQGIQTVRSINPKIFLYWAAIIFRFNQDQIHNICNQAQSLGMDGVQLTKSTKFGSIYESYGGTHDILEPRPEFISSSLRYERQLINISNRQQDNLDYLNFNEQKYFEIKKKYNSAPITPMCEIGNRGIYVNAEGVVFPCSWVSFPYQSLTYKLKTIEWGDSFFSKYRNNMNLNYRSFDEIISDPLWSKCSQGFTDDNKSWVECSQKCNSNLVNKEYAVGYLTN